MIENPLPPIPGFDIADVKRKTNYTPEKLRNIQAKRINMLRLGMANVLFMSEEPDEADENVLEDAPIKKHYPPIYKDKTNLNSAVIGRNDTMTLSCFSRPTNKSVVTNFVPVQNVLNKTKGLELDERLVPHNRDKYIES